MTKEDIIKAYVRIRTIDNSIPDEVLDFMLNAALEILKQSTSTERGQVHNYRINRL